MIRTLLRLCAALSCTTLITACSIVPKAEPATVYQLAWPATNPAEKFPPVPYSLSIDTPASSRSIDSTRILVEPADTRLSAYKAARWSDTVPAMLREIFSTAFRDSGAFRAVSNAAHNYRTDLSLGTEIMAFQVQYRPDGVYAVVNVDVFLSSSSSQTILATERFSIEKLLRSTALPDAVQALSLATDALAVQVVKWAVSQARKSSVKAQPGFTQG